MIHLSVISETQIYAKNRITNSCINLRSIYIKDAFIVLGDNPDNNKFEHASHQESVGLGRYTVHEPEKIIVTGILLPEY